MVYLKISHQELLSRTVRSTDVARNFDWGLGAQDEKILWRFLWRFLVT